MERKITYRRPDGKECNAYYAIPAAAEAAPGVVVLQEWWGLNKQIKGVADRLAEVGYRALVPDLYRGKVTLEAAEAEHLMSNLDFGDAATQDIRGPCNTSKGPARGSPSLVFAWAGFFRYLLLSSQKRPMLLSVGMVFRRKVRRIQGP